MKQTTHYDVIIVGGGMVGATAAVQFAQQGKSVLMFEKFVPNTECLNKLPLRVSAINRFSQDYLEQLTIWSHIDQSSLCQFRRLATWQEKDSHAKVMFDCEEVGQSHLGHIIRNEAIQLAAFQAIKQYKERIHINEQLNVCSVSESENEVKVIAKSEQSELTFTASVLVGADGANSKVRSFAGIGVSGWNYHQHCLSITIATDFPEQDITWQEFQSSGPKAFLPLSDGHACLIWYDKPEKLDQLMSLNPIDLKKQITDTFPQLPGAFSVKAKAKFPLTRRQANDYATKRVVLVGDAAHTINPLAGQGVNLGFKDVHQLAQVLKQINIRDGVALSKALKDYQRIRKADSLLMSSAMDAFYLMFSNDNSILRKIRSLGLRMANKSGFAKKQVLKKAMGY